MVFSSPTFFFLFLPAAFLVNLLFRRSIRWSNALLLVVSLLFYAWGEPVSWNVSLRKGVSGAAQP